MNYPVPHWIQAANPAQHFLTGMQQGASIAHAQNTLMQQERELQAKLAIAEMQNEHNQESLAIERARAQAQIQMQQAQVDQHKALLAQKARQYQAQQAYAEAVRNGADPARALLEYGGLMGMGASEIGAALRSITPRAIAPRYNVNSRTGEILALTPQGIQQVRAPSQTVDVPEQTRQALGPDGKPMEDWFWARSPGGGWVLRQKHKSIGISAEDRATLSELRAMKKEITDRTISKTRPKDPGLAKQWDEDQASLKWIDEQTRKILPGLNPQGTQTQTQTPATETGTGTKPGGITFKRIREKGSEEWTDLGGEGEQPEWFEDPNWQRPEEPKAAAETPTAQEAPKPAVSDWYKASEAQAPSGLGQSLAKAGRAIRNTISMQGQGQQTQEEYRAAHPAKAPEAPDNPSDREEGKVYSVPDWPMVWNGDSFESADETDQEVSPQDERYLDPDSDYYSDDEEEYDYASEEE